MHRLAMIHLLSKGDQDHLERRNVDCCHPISSKLTLQTMEAACRKVSSNCVSSACSGELLSLSVSKKKIEIFLTLMNNNFKSKEINT